ncbi:hypothetical protein L6R53_11395 [Myxococcota bacterium]|nr:hypothetical protein [Myxococcota bacterium]
MGILTGSGALARPYGYSTAVCNPDGVDVCTYNTSTDRWTCDTTKIAVGSDPVTAWMVTQGTACYNVCEDNPYCAFGTKGDEQFYCELAEGDDQGSDMVEGWLLGTPGDDQLSFWYQEGSGGGAFNCYMGNAGLDVTKVVGKIFADDGEDLVLGSWETNTATYQDDLYGDGDNDTMMAYPGADIGHGGEGNDDIHMGDGDDVVFGDTEADNITLGYGDDEGWGGPGVDQMCAEDDDYDELHGGNDQDNLWGDDETDHAWGDGNAYDGCRADVEDGTCEGTLVAEPESCPSEITAYPL